MIRAAAAILFIICTLFTGGAARQQGGPPTSRVHDCTSSGCHADQVSDAFLHGPTAAGACEMCHVYDNPATHSFTFKRTGAAMCDFCHADKTAVAGMQVHAPVQQGQCLECHDPHGSHTRALIRGADEASTCLTCHPDVASQAHLHGPIQEGRCTDCHRAHASLHDHLLLAEGRSLCMRCHEAVDEPMQGRPNPLLGKHPQVVQARHTASDEHPEMLPVHAPVMQECSACHQPHGSAEVALLNQSPAALCVSCHADVGEIAEHASVAHSVVMNDRACLNCHDAHRSDVPALLKNWPSELCMDCHREPITRPDGTIVQAAMDIADPHAFVHEPLRTGTCASCHDVHGGEHRGLLTKPYTGSFYESYSADDYALCLSCHQADLATAPTTTTATGFRNGDRNLHFVHVVEPGNGRTCRACHGTHSAPAAHQLRQSTAYGQWQIPINFEPTESGGSCAAGCHRARSYDREQPVAYDAPAAALPAETPAPPSSR